ncbi:hypothetical protein IBX73_11385, partial [candidate division WOR-3 bacterium]|nr:hypothetical protein [candidate division WOR-3 bacterium]
MVRFKMICAIALMALMGFKIIVAEPTAKTYIFAASHYMFYHDWQGAAPLDSLCKHFDVIIFHDGKRDTIPTIRDSTKVEWRRDRAPLLLLYKDAMTLVGPGNPWNSPYGDSTPGGGMTVGGWLHFDSLFSIKYPTDTFFMLATYWTGHYDTITIGADTLHRVHAGSDSQWQWRWAMDYGEPYWQNLYACTTKVQCLRNYNTLQYDDTYFDGIFIDNLLQFCGGSWDYSMYPKQYILDTLTGLIDSVKFRDAVHSFAQTASAEYNNPETPPGHGRQIRGVANLNFTCVTPEYEYLWRRNMSVLDGGMEESFALYTFSFERWRKLVHEIAIAESLGKMCLMCKKVAGFDWEPDPPWAYPFGYTEFDSTDLIFGFASYLMAFDSLAHFYFTPDTAYHYTFICLAPILDIDIGKPMDKYILRTDSLAYRYYEEGVVFANATPSSKTAGFSGDTLLLLDAKAEVSAQVELFTLNHHEGAICLYPLNYFHGSSFEPADRLCWENYCLEVEGITNYGAERKSGVPPNGVTPPAGDWMYKIYGQDVNNGTSFVRFKVFPYNILIKDSTYFSFWIYVENAPGDSAPIGIDCSLKSGKRLSEWTKYGTILDQYGRGINPANRRVPEGA